MADIDVIIPVHNGEKWLGETLDAVTGQTLTPRRIIVVDDVSSDGSVAVAEGFAQVAVVRNPQPGSPSRARNFGLTHAEAPLVAFCDQDDVWHPEHLARLAALLAEDPQAAAAAARYLDFQDGDQPRFDLSDTSARVLRGWEDYPFGGHMEPSLVLFRRAVFHRLQWSDDMDGCADRFLFHQVLVHHAIVRSEQRTVARRVHPDSYYQTMMRSHPVKHFRRLENLSRRLFEYYVIYRHEHREFTRVALRAGIMGLIADIIEAVLADDEAGLQAAAAALEGVLTVDTPVIRENTFEQLYVLMTHHNDGIKEVMNRTDFCEYLCARWPADCPVTAAMVREKTIRCRPGIGFYLGHILRHPLRLRCYNLFGQALRRRWTAGPQRTDGAAALN